jgi:hypothetical protein
MARFTTTQSKVGGATSRLSRFIPAARWATLIGAVAVLLFGTPADALWAIVALGATVVTPSYHTDWSRTALSITAAALPPTV